jgi:hypothetical protein
MDFVYIKATGAYNYQLAIKDVLFVFLGCTALGFFSDGLKL